MEHILRAIIITCLIFGVIYPAISVIYYKIKSKGKDTIKSILERIGF